MLIWTTFDSFAITCISNISSFLQKLHFPVEVVLNSLQTQKGLELVFRSKFSKNFFIKFSVLLNDINWPNLINRLCLLQSYSVKCIPYFMLRHLMSWNLNVSSSLDSEKSFWSEIKSMFPNFTSALFQA